MQTIGVVVISATETSKAARYEILKDGRGYRMADAVQIWPGKFKSIKAVVRTLGAVYGAGRLDISPAVAGPEAPEAPAVGSLAHCSAVAAAGPVYTVENVGPACYAVRDNVTGELVVATYETKAMNREARAAWFASILNARLVGSVTR